MGDSTEEIAKSVGKVADTVREYRPEIAKAGQFFARIFGPPAEELSGMFSDYLKAKRLENLIKTEERILRICKERNINRFRTISLSTSIPLLEAMTLEDDPILSEMFAELILSFTSLDDHKLTQKRFISTLKELLPFDAVVLIAISNAPSESLNESNMLYSSGLPHVYRPAPRPEDSESVEPQGQLLLSLSTLHNLGLITGGMTWGGYTTFQTVRFTEYGRAFLSCCKHSSTSGKL